VRQRQFTAEARPPNKRAISVSLALVVTMVVVEVATVSQSAEVVMAKLAMTVTNPSSSGSWPFTYCSATLVVLYPAPLAVFEMMYCSR
jgi:hypothetical protein